MKHTVQSNPREGITERMPSLDEVRPRKRIRLSDILSQLKKHPLLLRVFLYLCVIAGAECVAAVWPFLSGASGQVGSFQTLLSLFFAQAAWSAFGSLVAMAAITPLVIILAPKKPVKNVIDASCTICAVFAIQFLLLTLIPTQALLDATHPTEIALGFLIGASSQQFHFTYAWLDEVVPYPPLLLAAILMLKLSGFTPAQLRPKVILAGIGGWLLIEIVVRPILLTLH